MWIKHIVIIRLAIACLMITLGALIYIITRHEIIFFQWIPSSLITALKSYSFDDSSLAGYFIVYCLPDGLWYGALLLMQSLLLEKSIMSKIVFSISLILPFVWEILQICDNVPGTFDPFDLLVYLVVALLFLYYNKSNAW